ncbi:MAG: hypothetical protein AAB834_01660, partial [Patescibacteria group bacterium]
MSIEKVTKVIGVFTGLYSCALFIVSAVQGGGAVYATVEGGRLYYVIHSVYTETTWPSFFASYVAFMVNGILLIATAMLIRRSAQEKG